MPVPKLTTKYRRTLYTLAVVLILGAAYLTAQSLATTRTQWPPPIPIQRPVGLITAKHQCAVTTPKLECRAALRRSIAATHWQRTERTRLQRRLEGLQAPVEHLAAWSCIHQHEGAWNANTSNGYYGGLQMDRSFMLTYGEDMIQRYGGWAHLWTPRDQMIVAERAYDAGRGYAPWPNTSRMCGLR